MRLRRAIVFLAFGMSVLLACAAASAAEPSKAERRELERALAQLVTLLSDGYAQAYPDYRALRVGHLFPHDALDAVALFSIEGFAGTNDHNEYLAYFSGVAPVREGKAPPKRFQLLAFAQIGGRAWRSFEYESATLGASSVTVAGKAYGENDASCCPSVPIRATFRYDPERGIVEDPGQP